MFLFLCVSFVFLENKISSNKRLILAGFLLSGIVLIHHHSMITSFLILGFYGFIESIAQRKISREAYSAIIVIGLGLLFSSFYSWHLFERVFTAQTSGVFRFKESLSFFKTVFVEMGTLFIVFAIIGFISFQKKRLLRGEREIQPSLRETAGDEAISQPVRLPRSRWLRAMTLLDGLEESDARFVYHSSWVLSLLLAFFVGYYVWKVSTKIILGDAFVAFTPSRFLTDMMYPLSLFAGFGIYQAVDYIKSKYSLILTVLVVVILSLIPIRYVVDLHASAVPKETVKTLLWIKNNAPKDSLVVNKGFRDDWAPYITERENTLTPMPTTDLPNSYMYSKYELASAILGKEKYTVAEKQKIIEKFKGREIYLYVSTPKDQDYLIKEFQSGKSFVYRVDTAKFGQM
jgi:hypothetical protein